MPRLLNQQLPSNLFVRSRALNVEKVHHVGPACGWRSQSASGGASITVWTEPVVSGAQDAPQLKNTAKESESASVLACIEELMDSHVTHLTVPATHVSAIRPLMGDGSGAASTKMDYWTHFAIDFAAMNPDVFTRAESVVDLDPHDQRINPLLSSSESAHIFAGDPRVHSWKGIAAHEPGEHRLISVGHDRRDSPGFAHVGSVCTDPRFRGQRFAEKVLNAIVHDAYLEGLDGVFLGMYSHNEAGRRLYLRNYFEETGMFVSVAISVRS